MPIFSIPKTSTTRPLRIAEVRSHGGYGAIGISLCPGKKQLSAFSGAWDRDLAMDIGTIRDWGAHAVVTLIEGQEAIELRVLGLGEEVRRHHMQWFHLPVPDVTAPGETFERAWSSAGPQLRAMLRDGSNVLVHCKGGLGRAGTVAARLLVELGMAPDAAIGEVRRVRPGAIETRAQEAHVQRQRTIGEPLPATERERRLDRACGALLGLAVGDAVGTTLEFRRRDSYEPLTDIGALPIKAGRFPHIAVSIHECCRFCLEPEQVCSHLGWVIEPVAPFPGCDGSCQPLHRLERSKAQSSSLSVWAQSLIRKPVIYW